MPRFTAESSASEQSDADDSIHSGAYDMASADPLIRADSDASQYSEYDLADPDPAAYAPSPETQRAEYARTFQHCIGGNIVGRAFQIVPYDWFQRWYVFSRLGDYEDGEDLTNPNPEDEDPGPADLTSLILPGTADQLRPGLVLNTDVCLMYTEAFETLRRFYPTSGPVVQRMYTSGIEGRATLELYPITVRLCTLGDYDYEMGKYVLQHVRPRDPTPPQVLVDDTVASLTALVIGKYSTLRQLTQLVLSFTGRPSTKRIRLSLLPRYPVLDDVVVISDPEPEVQRQPIHSFNVTDESVLLIEDLMDHSATPAVCFGTGLASTSRSSSVQVHGDVEMTTFNQASTSAEHDDEFPDAIVYSSRKKNNNVSFQPISSTWHRTTTPETSGSGSGLARGVCGLNNLGNTCYMASALQCIMHVQQLVTYFVSDQYKFEVNTDNPLGYNGDIANAFAGLIKQIYSVERFSSVRPANLKKVLGKYNEQFGGFNQQDAQELLAFLMDGIHEDLNRVLKKQPTEKVEGTDFDSDEAAATEALARHHKRHQSIIVDLFQGQYKSTVICSVCNSRSVTFDPYTTLSLPIKAVRELNVHFHSRATGGVPPLMRKYRLTLPMFGSILDLKRALQHLVGVDTGLMCVRELLYSKFYLRERFDDASLDTIRDNDVMWVYEMAPTPAEPPTQAPVAAEPPPEHIETFPSMAVDGESNTDEVYTGDFQADEKHEAAAHQAASSEASTAQPGDSSQLAVPSKILMLSDALIKQAMDTYACYICHQATTSDLICAHKYCDDDCLVCLECMAGPNMPVTTRAGMDYAVCPQCLHEGEEKEWPVLFEYITGMSPPASPLLNARRSAAASSPRIPPPVPPRRPKVFKSIVASFIHRKKEIYSSYAQPLGIPFVLALPNMGLTAGMLMEAVKDYLVSRGVLLHVTTDEANRFHDEETPAQLGPYSIIPLTDDGCCRRCVKLSTGYGKYSSCTGCSPLSEHDELDPLDQYSDFAIYWNDTRALDKTRLDAFDIDSSALDAATDTQLSLDSCLRMFSSAETLKEGDAWKCPSCGTFQEATKTMELWSRPDVLIVHLKRFRSHGRYGEKISSEVFYPIENFDLSPHLGGPQRLEEEGNLYDLIGVVKHSGELGFGHYTALCLNPTDSTWYDFNDSWCSREPLSRIQTSDAYCLFYKRKLAPVIPLDEVLEAAPLSTQQSTHSSDEEAHPQSITEAVSSSRRIKTLRDYDAADADDDDGFGESAEPYMAQQWTFPRVGAATLARTVSNQSSSQDELEPGSEWYAGT